MAIDPTPALRLAVLALLRADGGVTFDGAVVPIFDSVADADAADPADDTAAVVILEEIELGEGLTKDGGPRSAAINLAIVVDGRSLHDAETLAGQVYARLEGVRPVLANHGAGAMRSTGSRTESSGDTGLRSVTSQTFQLMIF